MELENIRKYFESTGVDLEDGIRLHYQWSPSMDGVREVTLYFSENIIQFDIGWYYDNSISIATPCLPSEISKKRKFIDEIDSIKWNKQTEPIKEDLIKYLRQLHGVDGRMTKAAR